jgi:hypothetical protein
MEIERRRGAGMEGYGVRDRGIERERWRQRQKYRDRNYDCID